MPPGVWTSRRKKYMADRHIPPGHHFHMDQVLCSAAWVQKVNDASTIHSRLWWSLLVVVWVEERGRQGAFITTLAVWIVCQESLFYISHIKSTIKVEDSDIEKFSRQNCNCSGFAASCAICPIGTFGVGGSVRFTFFHRVKVIKKMQPNCRICCYEIRSFIPLRLKSPMTGTACLVGWNQLNLV